MRNLLLTLSLFCASFGWSQSLFQQAYLNHPFVPSGLLESVAWNNTRMAHLSGTTESCSGMPQAFGIMGLFDDGKNYFIENGALIANISGISISDQKATPENQIAAYAIAFNTLMMNTVYAPSAINDADAIRSVLLALSEIPDSGTVNLLARDMQVYSVLSFMNSAEKAQQYGFTKANFNLEMLFGTDNYKVLSAKKIQFTENGIKSSNGGHYVANVNKSSEYGPAIWNPAAICNFSSRNGVAVSAITIHTVQGTYAGCISWFQNCSASVSAHYVVRSSDGQITQMVLESDKAWHVGSENPYTIGYEHEGYVDNPSWYTEAMYTSSANLSIDIVNSGYGILPLRTFDGPATVGTNLLGSCIKIKGHQHYPNQTHVDPGINWDWEKYYQLINDPPSIITVTAASGNLYDTGGAASDYPDDERQLWLIQPPSAQSITLNFTAFDLENNWDYLYIYDGDTLSSPLIGTYTGTNSPGTIFSSGGSLLLEFRSDCSTTAPGWIANYSQTVSDATPPLTMIQPGTTWQTDDFAVSFTDTDVQSGVAERFYLAGKKDPVASDWSSDGNYGFAYETFEDASTNWTPVTGTYAIASGAFEINGLTEGNSNTYLSIAQTNTNAYLYEWDQTITSSSGNQRAGMHFYCDDPTLPNRGNSYFIYLRETDNKVQIYSVNNDVFNLEADIAYPVNQGQTYNCKTYFNPVSGLINVYIDDSLIGSWEDLDPLVSGNSISLRTGNCDVVFDNIRVYQSRGNTVTISAGFTDLMSIESEGAVPTGVVRSLALDSAGNWSLPVMENYLLDFSPPIIDYLYDGNAIDIDTFFTSTIEANWNALDIHSGIGDYEVAIGTLPTIANIYPWTSNGLTTAFAYVLNNPIYNQVYHVSLRVYNQAGLSDQFISDGQLYIDDLGISGSTGLEFVHVFPNPASTTIHIEGIPDVYSIYLYDIQGKICLQGRYESNEKIQLPVLEKGVYNLLIKSGSDFIVKRLVIEQ